MARVSRHTAPSSLHLRRLPRPGLVLGYGLGVGAVAAVAFVAGASIRDPAHEAIAHTDERIAVTAEVTERVVSDSSLGNGTVRAGRTVEIRPAPAEAARYVTEAGVQSGKKYRVPQFVGAVNDRPLFAVDFDIPLYRDLTFDDAGPDVRSLRDAFDLAQDGKVTWELLDRVGALYTQAGYPMPGGKGKERIIRAADFTDIGSASFTVGSIRPLGAAVADGPLATLITSPNVVTVRVSMLDVGTIEKGEKVTVSTPDDEYPASIARIGEFSEDDQGVGGYQVTIALASAKQAATLDPDEQVSVERAAGGEKTKAVPLQAIHQAGSATYVLLPAPDSETAPRRIDVTVTGQGEGWAALDADDLALGTRVLISN